ncbi:ribosomal protein L7/L12 [Phyllobacterium sp. OV277]|uniref:ribosomal protein L7/L12 n=1 Tax=Phyllobacterium sp. OV277 TaxID=1882772 RepID=UPI0008816BA0|nr:ribosomal protein L7/L12 [Phyllobacterium sp. OV277]SDP33757.1 Ribosomal protein L7/L12 C-terminal domain-containing protein [Phyllobacterium sp. OV277]
MRIYQRKDPFDESIRDFLANGIVVGNLALPTHYAEFERLDDFQVGFRRHGHTGENLVSEIDGEWRPGWYVIAMTGLDDPVFIDKAEGEDGYPVYTAVHGAGRWDAMRIAPSLAAFGRLLEVLAEVKKDILQFERIVVTEIGPPNRYWRKVLDEHQQAARSENVPSDVGHYSPADFERGDLIVTDVGSQKLKVVQIVSKCRGLSLKDALALTEAPQFEAGSGVRLQLRRLSDQLEALGATVEFRAER